MSVAWQELIKNFGCIDNFLNHAKLLPRTGFNVTRKVGNIDELIFIYYGPNYKRDPKQSDFALRRFCFLHSNINFNNDILPV